MRRPRRRKRRALTRRADSIWRTRTGSPRLTRPKFAVPGGTQIIRKNGFHTFHLIIRFNRSVYACVGFFGMQLSEVLITLSRLRAEWYSKTGSPGEITRVRT